MFDLTDSRTKATAWKIAALIIVALFLFFGIRAVVQSFVVEGPSMEPSLHNGQFVIVNKAAYWFGSPQRGDIVVYRSPALDRMIIHRIVGMPGDKVKVEEGKVFINGEEVVEPYAQGDIISFDPETVPEGCYFILGDNRNGTSCEMVPKGNIIGKAWLSIWPLSEWGFVPNYPLEAGGQ